jgi:endo-1,4-beta-mannosidase
MRPFQCLTCLILCVELASVAGAKNLPKITVAKDGDGFVTSKGQPFVPFGVTYYRPGTGWAPQVWKQFDTAATRKDFARMKKMGIDCVRVFLSYGSFYHTPGVLDTNGLAKFDQFLQIAENAGIYVHPTGPDLWEGAPEWPIGGVGDEKALRLLEEYWKMFAARYRGRNVIFAYDLRNEPEVGWEDLSAQWEDWQKTKLGLKSPLPVPSRKDAPNDHTLLEFQLFREHLADEWTRRQVAAIKFVDPDALVSVGAIQWSVPSLLPGQVAHYSGFRPERQAKFLDFMEIHFYPLESGGYKYHDAESEQRNLSYLETVVRAAKQPGKPLVVSEFGWYGGTNKPTFNNGQFPQASEAAQAQYDSDVVNTSAKFACGWLNWGFYDQPEAGDCSQQTGLVAPDGRPKAWGQAFQKLAKKYRGKAIQASGTEARPTMDWDACLSSMAAENAYRDAYFAAFSRDH